MPHLEPQGFLHAQTNPCQAHNRDATVAHALRLTKLYHALGLPRSRVCIKIPSTLDGLAACAVLEKEHGVRTLATTCFCLEQGLAAAEAGCLYVAPYVNPLCEQSWAAVTIHLFKDIAAVHFVPSDHRSYADPLTEMPGIQVSRNIQASFDKTKSSTQVLAARFDFFAIQSQMKWLIVNAVWSPQMR